MSLERARQQHLDGRSFDTIAQLAYRESGLTLVPEKALMVQSRLRHRLRALGLTDFAEYTALLSSSEGASELQQLISALTTNVSHFFREPHHFDRLVQRVTAQLPDLRAGAPLRLWSAGCAHGQEPLSMAIALTRAVPDIAAYDLRILATDIDPKVIGFAKTGRYPARMLARLPEADRDRWFRPQTDLGSETAFTPDPALRRLIRYNTLNLLADWPMQGRFDAIFCRNTLIYFDIHTQEALWPRFRQALQPGGLLVLGHSERIAQPERHGFTPKGTTLYQPVCQ